MNRRWSRRETALLVKYRGAGMAFDEIGGLLDRTACSVKARCRVIGCVDRDRRFTSEQIAKVRAEYGRRPTAELAADLARTIEAASGRAFATHMDVTSSDSIRAAFDAAEMNLGVPNIIVNNSGVSITKPLLEQQEADWDVVV